MFAFMPHFHTQKVGHGCWLSGSACLLVEGGREGRGGYLCIVHVCVAVSSAAHIGEKFSLPPQDPKGWLVECMNIVSSAIGKLWIVFSEFLLAILMISHFVSHDPHMTMPLPLYHMILT